MPKSHFLAQLSKFHFFGQVFQDFFAPDLLIQFFRKISQSAIFKISLS